MQDEREIQMRTKRLPPYAPTLIESTRAIGYSLEAAVADIIDNSIEKWLLTNFDSSKQMESIMD